MELPALVVVFEQLLPLCRHFFQLLLLLLLRRLCSLHESYC